MADIEFNCISCDRRLSVSSDYAGMQFECPNCSGSNTVPVSNQDEKCSECGKKMNVWNRNPQLGICEDCARNLRLRRQTDNCIDCGKSIKGFERYPDTNTCTDCYTKREKALQKAECQECGKALSIFTRIVGTNYCFDCNEKLRNSGRLPKCASCGIPLNISNVEPGTPYCSQCLNNNPSLLDRSGVRQDNAVHGEVVVAPAGVLQEDPFYTGGLSKQEILNNDTMDLSSSEGGKEKIKARYKILIGLFWFVLGIGGTAATDGQYLFWGAIVFGFIDMLVGLFQGLAEGF